MRRLLSTVALVVVLAGLGAYIYFVDSKRPAGGIEEKQKVFTVEADKIEEITVTSENETTTLRKADGTWRLIAPLASDADQSEASTVTSSLASLEVNRVVDENTANLAEYGLAEPRIKVAFKAADGVAGELHLGDKTATQSDVYAVKPGEKRVFLVQAFHETSFAKKPFDLRDKRILMFERDKVDSIELTGGKVVQLARAGSDWVVKQPMQARGDYSAVEGLLTRLSSASMTRLVEPSTSDPAVLAKYELDKPRATVTIGAGSSRATLALGKEEDGAVYARDQARGMVFAVDPTLVADIGKPAEEFRKKDLFEFRNFNVARIRVTRGADTYEFQKVAGTGENTPEKWQRVVAGGTPADVDAAKMDDLLTKLTSLRAQSFKTSGGTLDKPALVISASYDTGKFERVRLAKTTEAIAVRDDEAGVAVLDAAAYDELIKAVDAVVAPPPVGK
jgi:Domain of unknown function (DUF4340)